MAPSAKPTAFAWTFLVVAFAGFLDASFLTVEHYRGVVPPCTILEGCEKVTTSAYSVVGGVPVALGGAIYYLAIIVLALAYLDREHIGALRFLARLTPLGFLASLWFLYLQLFVLHAICIYCVFSAATSTLLFATGMVFFASTRRSAP